VYYGGNQRCGLHHWYDLIGKGATLGKNKFNIYVSTKRCVVIFLLATAILLPFIIILLAFIFRSRPTADGLYVWFVP
jgi:uncharacterized membrane protein YjgN (DUF898 family)